jgi:hypothetical protein
LTATVVKAKIIFLVTQARDINRHRTLLQFADMALTIGTDNSLHMHLFLACLTDRSPPPPSRFASAVTLKSASCPRTRFLQKLLQKARAQPQKPLAHCPKDLRFAATKSRLNKRSVDPWSHPPSGHGPRDNWADSDHSGPPWLGSASLVLGNRHVCH